MALGTDHSTVTTQANFIPEIWSDEVIAGYKSNLVLANLVTKLKHNGKKGDTIHIPKPTRGSANAKVAETQVVLNANTESEIAVSINKHYEYSKLIEDIVSIQGLDSMRGFYTEDAGYALAKQVDTDLFSLVESFQGGSIGGGYAACVIGGDGSTAYNDATTGNGSTLTDAGIRKMIQTLDDADVPQSDRYLIIPPVEKKTLLGLARFTEQAFTGEMGSGNSIRTGLVGDIYGIKVYVSTNCPTETADDATTLYRVGMMLHKSAMVHAEQMGVRSQTQYKQEHLGDLFTTDTIYGVSELRDDAAIGFVVPA